MAKLTVFLFMLALAVPALAQKKIIRPPEFPAGPPFSPGVLAGNTLYVAGQTGYDLKTDQMPESFEVELRQTFDKIGLVLKAAGMNYTDVVNVTVYLTDMRLSEQMTAIYRTYFKTDPPARVVVQVAGLVRGARVAVAAIASK